MSDAWMDRPRPMRSGEELDVVALESYLRSVSEELRALPGPFALEQFPGGHSNLTYLLRAGENEYVLRRPPFGAKTIKAGHDMGREYRILSRLRSSFASVPRTVLFCEEADSPFQAQFYLMERVRGVVLRARPPQGLELSETQMRSLSENTVDTLAALHTVDIHSANLADIGRPEGYLRRQVEGWTERYQKAKTDDVPGIDGVMQWLAENVPTSPTATMIHNDFKYDNLVLDVEDITKVRAVLDWEMATIGDPLSDLGMTLAYWIEPNDPDEYRMMGLGLTTLPGNFTREEVVQRYAQKTGRDVRDVTFYFALGLFKIAVIAQQIYARYKRGFTSDERFARFVFGVMLFARAAHQAIASKSLTSASRLDLYGL